MARHIVDASDFPYFHLLVIMQSLHFFHVYRKNCCINVIFMENIIFIIFTSKRYRPLLIYSIGLPNRSLTVCLGVAYLILDFEDIIF